MLPLPLGNLALEVFLLACLSLCEALRMFFGWKGNLTESAAATLVATLLLVPGVLGVLFFLIWQVCTTVKL